MTIGRTHYYGINMKPVLRKLFLIIYLIIYIGISYRVFSINNNNYTLKIKKSPDFVITGDGNSKQWETAKWVDMPQRKNGITSYDTKVKILYSETGIYFLFNCKDNKITSTLNEDNLDLYTEDVVEVFLWTDEGSPVYFEYELSPLNNELPILVLNYNGNFQGWLPWHYEDERKTRHATSVNEGDKKSGSLCTSWTAEFFIPYKLLLPLQNVPPKSGTKWRANLYRIDFDNGKTIFSWKEYVNTFHDYYNFGTFYFE